MESILNALPQIFLFGSVLYFYLFSLIFLTILFFADYHESGFHAFGAFLIFLGVTFYWGTFEPLEYLSWGSVGLYLGIGFLYSLVRTYFYGRKALVYGGYKTDPSDDEKIKYIENQISERKVHLKGNVFRWWFLFPVSFIDWVLSDLVKDIYDWIYKYLHKLYDSILDIGLKSAER